MLNSNKRIAVGMSQNTSKVKSIFSPINVSNPHWKDGNVTSYTDDFLLALYRHSSTYIIVLAVWTFIINFLTICACIRPFCQRRDFYYVHIINYSTANIVIGTYVLPLSAYHILHPWELGQFMCKMWIIADVLLPFVEIIIIIMINMEHLLTINHLRFYTFLVRKCSWFAILALPWCLASVVVIPIWTIGAVPYDYIEYQCIVMIETVAGLLCPVLTYFLPLVIITILTLKLLLLWLQVEDTGLPIVVSSDSTARSWRQTTGNGSLVTSTERCRSSPSQLRKDSDHKTTSTPSPVSSSTKPTAQRQLTTSSTSSPSRSQYKTGCLLSVCLLNFTFTVMWFPFQCVSFLLPLCSSEMCVPSLNLTQIITLIAASSSGVTPLCWLADRTLKANLATIFGNVCFRCSWHQDKVIGSGTIDAEETFV